MNSKAPNTKKLLESLVASAQSGNTKRCIELIKAGAPVNGNSRKRRTPLIAAIASQKEVTASELLKHGADPNQVLPVNDYAFPLFSPLMLAARLGLKSCTKALIKAGADVRYARRGGGTALTQAASHGHLEIVRMLLKSGAPLVCYALSGAVWNRQIPIAKILLSAGADPNHQDKTRDTVLMIAAGDGDLRMVKLLLANGANINGSHMGLTPLVSAILRNHDEVALHLMRAGADIEFRDNGGRTPLLFASENGALKVAKKLVERGVDLSIRDPDGLNAIQLAEQAGDRKMTALLAPHFSKVNN